MSGYAAVEAGVPEFGTGLRARLELVRPANTELAPRRDVSPELVLVSPELAVPEDSAQLLQALEERVMRRGPLGALLAEAGLLPQAALHDALREADRRGKRIGEVLVESGLVSADDVVRLVAEQRGLPFIDLHRLELDPAAARLLPIDVARVLRTLPVGFARGLPVVAVADPTDDAAMQTAESMLRCVRFVASLEESILAGLDRVYRAAG